MTASTVADPAPDEAATHCLLRVEGLRVTFASEDGRFTAVEDVGYKGFGFGLMVEAYGQALLGHGRSTPKQRGAQGVFLQTVDPAGLGDGDAFLRETSELVRRCRAARPAGSAPVRLPGERAYAELRRQVKDGIEVPETLVETVFAQST